MKPRHLKRKTITRIFICIVVGLITSVGVAWVAAVTVDRVVPRSGPSAYVKNFPAWGYVQLQGFTFLPIYVNSESFPTWGYVQSQGTAHVVITSAVVISSYGFDGIKKGPEWSIVRQDPVLDNLQSIGIAIENAWGWPIVCMSSRIQQDISTKDRSTMNTRLVFGIPLGTRNVANITEYRLLPTRPIWFNLLMNTSLYAIITWFVIALLTRRRNAIRRKRGQCIHCRYNVRDLPVCPECGNEVGLLS